MSQDSEVYECIATYDFSKYKMDTVIAHDWSQCQISPEAVTYDEVVFQVNPNHPMSTKATKSYFWYEKIHTDTDPTKLDRAKNEIVFERIKVQSLN